MKLKNKSKVAIIVLSILAIALLTHLLQKSNEEKKSINIEHDDVTFYGRESCPFCVKMKKQLQNDNIFDKITYVDVESQDGHQKFQQLSAEGVPHFTSKSTGKQTTGFQKTETLIDNLGLN